MSSSQDVRRWRDGPVRSRWLKLLEPIAALPAQFAQATETSARAAIMDEARRQLQNVGTVRETSDRFLYSAANPIGEECFRECGFTIGEELINEVTVEAAPWIDLWRDNYAFVASRVAAGLRHLFEKAPLQNGALPLPAFLRHCAALKMSLTGPAMVGLAHMAFQEVKAAFREQIRNRPEAEEWELSADDCHFIRENFQYEQFDEFTYPSADIQLEARSVEAVGRGRIPMDFGGTASAGSVAASWLLLELPGQSRFGPGVRPDHEGLSEFSFRFFRGRFYRHHLGAHARRDS